MQICHDCLFSMKIAGMVSGTVATFSRADRAQSVRQGMNHRFGQDWLLGVGAGMQGAAP